MVGITSAFWDIPGIQSQRSLEFLANLLDPIVVYGKQGQVVYASSSFLSLLRQDIEQVSFFSYFGTGIPLVTLQQLWQEATRGEPIKFFAKVQNSSKTLVCSLHFSRETELMFLIAREFKQRSPTQALMQGYEKILSVLTDHPNLATVLLRPDGLIVRSNSKFHELMAIDPDEQIDIADLSHPEDRLLDRDLRQKLLDNDLQTYTIEKRFISRTNEVVWFNCSVSILHLPEPVDGYHYYFMTILEDITENKKIYSALVRTEGKWKAFVLNSLNLFIQTTSQGQIIYMSPAVERILGYGAEELLDLSITELIHLGDLHKFNLAMDFWQNNLGSDRAGIECRWQTKANNWVYLYIQGQRFPLGLDIDGIVISGYEITQRKRLEAELRSSQEKYRSLILCLPQVGRERIPGCVAKK
ncbi:PAS domain-containing protein [Leptolyngbya ohadii]|uniref:PAS domain-containing protein n=1 Tax=Leptolyngbya ohadii TaxID=1962290 RepID=UPI000B599BED|nr:PAS domain-containing protein [Leptolyngbya ohadii]